MFTLFSLSCKSAAFNPKAFSNAKKRANSSPLALAWAGNLGRCSHKVAPDPFLLPPRMHNPDYPLLEMNPFRRTWFGWFDASVLIIKSLWLLLVRMSFLIEFLLFLLWQHCCSKSFIDNKSHHKLAGFWNCPKIKPHQPLFAEMQTKTGCNFCTFSTDSAIIGLSS